MNTLLNLLLLYNDTVNVLNGKKSKEPDTLRLTSEIDSITSTGCPFDCCDTPLLETLPTESCSSRGEKFLVCREFVNVYSSQEHMEDIRHCVQQRFIENYPFTFRNFNLDQVDTKKCNETLARWNPYWDDIDSLLLASNMYIYLENLNDDTHSDDNLLTACFWPESIPDNFRKRNIKKAARVKRDTLSMRKHYLLEDIRLQLKKYQLNINLDVSVQGSGME